ncbi:Uncharacterised protein [Burkholderia pseudomallei]|uniref:hypothetical protein n=1 Tax=Burkholderia pseudomallei TaxID=28450 RepID=UPI00016ABFA1|nr:MULTISPECIES: hypothetical protein [pseudomallei group]AGK47697.1 hypothetical protein BTI_1598 [Burkholderia thailandensis MSMB121]KGW49478.1 hypothetical protein Y049_490 [Burkholderia pseudomallei MSHR684]AIV79648.1 hypothetical protein X994_1367 [Burkholderia pseudomallei]ATF36676.1 hypothetical protein CO709_27695 [Burkholderia thailandensis]AYX28454.1 hypothetical protein EGY16_10320 [Burkholderia pseudomallei]
MEKTVDILKTEAEIAKLMAETQKLNAEAGKFKRETFLMPFVAGFATLAASIGAVAGFAKLFVH